MLETLLPPSIRIALHVPFPLLRLTSICTIALLSSTVVLGITVTRKFYNLTKTKINTPAPIPGGPSYAWTIYHVITRKNPPYVLKRVVRRFAPLLAPLAP